MRRISWALCFTLRGATYNDIYAEVPHESGIFFRRQLYERVGVSQFKEFERVAEVNRY